MEINILFAWFSLQKKIKFKLTIKQSTLETDPDMYEDYDVDVSLAVNDNHRIAQAVSILKSTMVWLIASMMWLDCSLERKETFYKS